MYAIDQYDWLQKYFYKDLWENEGKKSVNFAFESFNELNSYLKRQKYKSLHSSLSLAF